MKTLTRQQVRDIDRRAIQDYGMSGLVLMENAGRGAADVLCALMKFESNSGVNTKPSPRGVGRVRASDSADLPLTPTLSQREREQKISIVCGKGNNGGDGFVVARHLDLRGLEVRVLLLAEPNELTGDAASNYLIIEKAGILIEVFNAPLDAARFKAAISGSPWLVDALLGTGATGEPKSPYAEAIEQMNASGISILAIDLPSGLDCDTGVPANHTILAAHTCTFVAAKPGLLVETAKPFVGELHVADIGVPRRLLAEFGLTEGDCNAN